MYFRLAAGTFFFDQKVIHKRKKRKRKKPDELPKSIRFASLNPKLAAFLANHDRQKAKRILEGIDVGEGESGLPGLEDPGSFLPNIHADNLLRLLRGGNDNFQYERDLPQRQRYQSAVSAAPTLILRLCKLLYLFKMEHLDLPGEIVNDLQSGYPELISDARYTNPDWQCLENIPEDEDAEDKVSEDIFDGIENQIKPIKTKSDMEGLTGDEAADEPEESAGEKKKKKKKKNQDKMPETPLTSLLRREGKESTLSSTSGSKRLTVSAATDKPKSGRRRSLAGRDGSTLPRMGLFSKYEDNGSSRTTDTPPSHGHSHGHGQGVHQPSFLQVISFSMTMKSCDEKGWIIKPEETNEEEQRSLIEKLIQRLQQSSREARMAAEDARTKGHDHPLTNRYYGDTKRALLMRYMNSGKKGSSRQMNRVPKIVLPSEQENKVKFLISLPDGTSSAFYPSGRLAVSVTNASNGRPGHYTLVYADNEERSLLALFTPTGKGSCYHPNGKISFCSTDKGCIVLDQEGSAVSRSTWPLPHSKLDEPVNIAISHLLTLKVHNFNQMTMTFECRREVARFAVGAHLIAVEPQTQEELGYIATSEEFTSNAAKEAARPPPQVTKKSKKGGVSKKNSLAVKRQSVDQQSEDAFNPLVELLHKLEIVEPGKYGIPAERELNRLLRKIKNTCDEWLDHYRLTLSIISPLLQRMPSAPKRRKGSAMSTKSTPASMPHPTSEQTEKHQEVVFEIPCQSEVGASKVSPRSLLRRSAVCKSAPPGVDMKLGEDTEEEDEVSSVRQGRVKIDLPGDDSVKRYTGSRTISRTSRYSVSAVSRSTRLAPSTAKTEVVEAGGDQIGPSPLRGCPVALRAEILGDTLATCKCTRHRIPNITDVELDSFLAKEVPKTQMVVLCVISTMFPSAMPCGSMLNRLYEKHNRNRTKPCYQSNRDPYRLLVYNMMSAAEGTSKSQPELYLRHNASPGMFMIYGAGKLLFCDHIFNGYGNERRDFQKQLERSRNDARERNFLPQDFRFSTVRCRRGPRSAWGGEIGGSSLDSFNPTQGLPNLDSARRSIVRSASASSVGSSRSQSFTMKPWTQTRPHTTAGRKVVSADSLTELAISRLPQTARPRIISVT